MKTNKYSENEHDAILREAERLGIKFIDLKSDFGFKYVFGMKGREKELLKLINCILPEKHIVRVELGPQEQVGDRPDARKVIYDIHCTTETGTLVDIEIQRGEHGDFGKRMVFYSSFAIRNSLSVGVKYYDEIPEIYVIGILDFIMPGVKLNPELINHYSLRNDREGMITLTDTVHYVTVELPKFTKNESELNVDADIMWYLFRNLDKLEEIPKENLNKGFDNIIKVSKFAGMKPEEQDRYFREVMYEMDERDRLRTAHRRGVSEGEARGEARGIVKGKEDVAREMKAIGLSVDIIVKCTGLTEEQIAGLHI